MESNDNSSDSSDSSENDESGEFFKKFCGICRKYIQKDEERWFLDDDGPIGVDTPGFCLCINCCPDPKIKSPLQHVDAILRRGHLYELWADQISGCLAHFYESHPLSRPEIHHDETSECTCHCAVCDAHGWPGCEKEWYCGEAKHFGDLHPHDERVRFMFILCPACVPTIVKESGEQADGRLCMKLSGEFSKKWFDHNLKKDCK